MTRQARVTGCRRFPTLRTSTLFASKLWRLQSQPRVGQLDLFHLGVSIHESSLITVVWHEFLMCLIRMAGCLDHVIASVTFVRRSSTLIQHIPWPGKRMVTTTISATPPNVDYCMFDLSKLGSKV